MKNSFFVAGVLSLALVLSSCGGASDEVATKKAHAVKRALFIGDSITDGGWGNSCGDMRPSAERNHSDMNHIYGHSYMMLCASEVQSRSPQEDIVFYNRGISGNTLADMAARWDSDAVALRPDLVTILVGTNDVEYYVAKDTVAQFDFGAWDKTYRALLDTMLNVCPDVRFAIGAPFVGKVGWRGAAPNYQLRERMIDSMDVIVRNIAADYSATLLPFDSLFCGLMADQPRQDYWIWDGVHPTPAGHRRMADLWLDKMLPVF